MARSDDLLDQLDRQRAPAAPRAADPLFPGDTPAPATPELDLGVTEPGAGAAPAPAARPAGVLPESTDANLERLSQRVQEDDAAERKWSAFKAARTDLPPERMVEILRLQAATKQDPFFIADNFDDVKRRVTQDELERAFEQAPHLAKYLSDAARAPLVKDDIANASLLEWMVTGKWESRPSKLDPFSRIYELKTGPVWARALVDAIREREYLRRTAGSWMGITSPENEARIDELRPRLNVDYGAENFVSRNFVGFFRNAPEALEEGLVVLGGGAAAGAAAGPGAPVAAVAGGVAAETAFEFFDNVGMLYDDLRQLKGADGQRLVDDDTARSYALAGSATVAAITGGLGFTFVRKAVPGVDSVLQKLARRSVSEAFEKMTTRQVAKHAIKDFGEAVGSGAAMMAVQSAVNAQTQELAAAGAEGRPVDWSRAIDAGVDGFTQALEEMTFLAAWGPGHAYLANLGVSGEVAASAQRLRAAVDTAAASKLVARSKPEAEGLVLSMAQEPAAMHTAYIAREAFDRTYEKYAGGPSAVAAELVGDGGKAYLESQASGYVAVPMAKYLARVAETEHAAALAKDVKFLSDSRTVREEELHQKQLAELEKAAKGTDPRALELEGIYQAKYQEQLAAGRDPFDADATARLVRNAVAFFAESEKLSPAEVLQRYPLTFRNAGPGAPKEKPRTFATTWLSPTPAPPRVPMRHKRAAAPVPTPLEAPAQATLPVTPHAPVPAPAPEAVPAKPAGAPGAPAPAAAPPASPPPPRPARGRAGPFGNLSPEGRRKVAAALRGDRAQILELAAGRFGDTLTPAGNKAALQDFLSRPHEGVWISLDFNKFKALNDEQGHPEGDRAIALGGSALAAASRAERGKLFRPGGDEFVAYFETPEQARRFLEAGDRAFQALPGFGRHQLSFSAGVAQGKGEAGYKLADDVLKRAKEAAHAELGKRGEETDAKPRQFIAWDGAEPAPVAAASPATPSILDYAPAHPDDHLEATWKFLRKGETAGRPELEKLVDQVRTAAVARGEGKVPAELAARIADLSKRIAELEGGEHDASLPMFQKSATRRVHLVLEADPEGPGVLFSPLGEGEVPAGAEIRPVTLPAWLSPEAFLEERSVWEWTWQALAGAGSRMWAGQNAPEHAQKLVAAYMRLALEAWPVSEWGLRVGYAAARLAAGKGGRRLEPLRAKIDAWANEPEASRTPTPIPDEDFMRLVASTRADTKLEGTSRGYYNKKKVDVLEDWLKVATAELDRERPTYRERPPSWYGKPVTLEAARAAEAAPAKPEVSEAEQLRAQRAELEAQATAARKESVAAKPLLDRDQVAQIVGADVNTVFRGLTTRDGGLSPEQLAAAVGAPGPVELLLGMVKAHQDRTKTVTLDQLGPLSFELHQEGEKAGPIWYSAVERAADAAKQAKNTPAAWWSLITKAPGVKAEELEWMGLKEWIDAQKGSLTKDQVLDAIRVRQVTIREKLLGEAEPDPYRDSVRAAMVAALKKRGVDVISDEEGHEFAITVKDPHGGEDLAGVYGIDDMRSAEDTLRNPDPDNQPDPLEPIHNLTVDQVRSIRILAARLVSLDDGGESVIAEWPMVDGVPVADPDSDEAWLAEQFVANRPGERQGTPVLEAEIAVVRQEIERELQGALESFGFEPAHVVEYRSPDPANVGQTLFMIERFDGSVDAAGQPTREAAERIAKKDQEERRARAEKAGKLGEAKAEIALHRRRLEQLPGWLGRSPSWWRPPEALEPQYEDYTVGSHEPGSYREILLYAPALEGAPSAALLNAREELAQRERALVETVRKLTSRDEQSARQIATAVLTGEITPEFLRDEHNPGFYVPANQLRYAAGRVRELETREGRLEYKAPHYSPHNRGLMAHVRASTHVDADGQKVLLLEELQSDLHHAGATMGYQVDDATRYARAKELLDKAGMYPSLEGGISWYVRQKDTGSVVYVPRDDGRTMQPAMATDLGKVVAEVGAAHGWPKEQLEAIQRQPDAAPPEAPFAETWHELAVKRLVRYAAEHGYTRIALTPAEVHVRRWGTELIAWEKIDAAKGERSAEPQLAADWAVVRPDLVSDLKARAKWIDPTGRSVQSQALEQLAAHLGPDTTEADARLTLYAYFREAGGYRPPAGVPLAALLWLFDQEAHPLPLTKEYLERPPLEGWKLLVKAQHRGEAAGMNLEDAAAARGLIAKSAPQIISTKEELRKAIERGMRGAGADAERTDVLVERAWSRMQEQAAGSVQPRAEARALDYDKRAKNALEKLAKKYGGKLTVGKLGDVSVQGQGPVFSTGDDVHALRDALAERIGQATAQTEAGDDEKARAILLEHLTYAARGIASSTTVAAVHDVLVTAGVRAHQDLTGHTMPSQLSPADEARWAMKALGIRGEDLVRDPRQEVWLATIPEAGLAKIRTEGLPLFQGKRGVIRITFPDGTGPGMPVHMDVGFLADADESTGAHEFSHWLGLVMGQLASRPDASPEIREAYATMLAHMEWASHDARLEGLRRKAELEAKPQAERTPAELEELRQINAKEERLSYGFEQYLGEGKAPSASLAGVFQRFKLWMIRIYRRLEGIAGRYKELYGEELRLSDPMRQLFDRLTKAEDEVARAEELTGAEAFQVIAGDDPEWKAARDREREESTRRLADTIRKAQRRESERFFAEETRRIRDEVERELDAEPPYRALAYLQRGWLPGIALIDAGLVGPDGKHLRLDRAVTRELLGEQAFAELPRGVTALRGADPEFIAGKVQGFKSGEDMLNQLRNLRPREDVVLERTKQRLEERYEPDLLANPQKLAEEALANVQSDAKAGRIMVELKYLARRLAPELNPRFRAVDLETMKETADRLARGKRENELAPGMRLNAERAAARRAVELAAAGKVQEAFEAKELQLWNMLLWRAERDVKEQARKDQAFLADAARDSTRKKVGKAGPTWLERLDDLTTAFGFRAGSPTETGRRARLEAFVQLEEANGYDPIIPQRILELVDAGRTWKDLTAEETGLLRDAVQSLVAQAHLANTFLVERRRADRKAVLAELSEQLRATFELESMDYDPNAKSRLQKSMKILSRLKAATISPEELIRQMDGGNIDGPWHRYVLRPIQDAEAAWHDLVVQVTKPIMDLIDKLPAAERRRLKTETFQVNGRTLTMEAALAVAFNQGTESNARKFLEGSQRYAKYDLRPFTAQDVDAILGHLTGADWDLVEQGWRSLDAMWPAMEELEKRLTGVAPPKQPPRSFTRIVDGKERKIAGGYYPMVYDPRFSAAGMRGEEKQTLRSIAIFDPGYARAATPQGHLQSRIESFSRPVLLTLDALPRALNEHAKDVTMREALLSVHRILTSEELHPTLERTIDSHGIKVLQGWLRDKANDLVVPDGGAAAVLSAINKGKGGFSGAIFAGNVAMWLQNLGGYLNAMNIVKTGYLWEGIETLSKNRKAIAAEIRAESGTMRHRERTFDRDVKERLQDLLGKRGALPRVKEHLLWGMQATDAAVAYPVYWGAKMQALAGEAKDAGVHGSPVPWREHRRALKELRAARDAGALDAEGEKLLPKLEAAENLAIRYANQAVRLSLASAENLPAMMRDPRLKWATMFMSFGNAQLNQLYGAQADGKRLRRDGQGWLAARKIARGWFTFTAGAIAADLLVGRGPSDDDDDGEISSGELAKWLIKRALYAPLLVVPILGSVFRGAESGRDVSLSPYTRAYDATAKALNAGWELASKAADPNDEVEAADAHQALARALEAGGYFSGLPVAQAGTTARYWLDEELEAERESDTVPAQVWQSIFGPNRKGRLGAAIFRKE